MIATVVMLLLTWSAFVVGWTNTKAKGVSNENKIARIEKARQSEYLERKAEQKEQHKRNETVAVDIGMINTKLEQILSLLKDMKDSQ